MTGTTNTIGLPDVAEIRDLKVRFATDGEPVDAVKGIDIRAHAGEVLAIVGESGSGKTVTANALLGLLPETATMSGAVIVRGRGGETDVVHASPAKLRAMRGRDAAMVFQEPSTALNPVYTVGWQIAEGLRAHADGRLSTKEAKAKAVEILRKVGIPDPDRRVDDYPHQFSGGQKQRIVIAMALVLNAGLIIADEPTTALDVTVQAEILELLRACRDEFGATIVLITHNMGVVADLADRVVVMLRGDIVEQAPVRELFANPQQDYTRELLAAVPHVGQGKSALVATSSPSASSLEDRSAPEPAAGSLIVARACEIGYPGRFGRGGVVAVKGVDFHVGPGEVVGLVGESGSGKTTIGRAVVGLTTVVGGSLQVLGQEMKGVKQRQLAPLRPEIGFVFQDPATSFNPLLSIAECIAEPLIVHGKASSVAAARAKVDELLDAVRLPTNFGDRYPHELSGGQRQRASLARALALDPKLLIADEPTSALDVSVQAKVLELFVQLQAELGFASLFISHDLAVIDAVADRIIVLQRGRIQEQGTTAQVLKDPTHAYTRELLAALPVPDPVEQAERRALWQAVRRG
ncbi:dipeptide ABC transporter ATP-binding protein [Microbacterium azadirachtae]|uniref:dipeptide ABC transporter ATP-binding protein n=1 Tax=Microbacterium azadirachtae TaxID=582680 RepID=UPI000883F6BB|nr:ABC transporter ATP-binding protein [Microbacterium azadirachtae]UXW85930.1 ABC transporter ATP-binding protein [Microbacterium azadirachtae]SDL68538.1 peptide/nickel transport system ATP-binding protein [Microbacterium azadirachtae]SEF97960.1 peptide/nickel transport system ATP-binding protein [Microbacterium azadirachtae]SEG00341.1 peptide/nickel transport system ATP-binding protein [Microbacterium azadirachtae]